MTTNFNLKKITEIARETRIWADNERKRFNFDETLCGMCAKASAELWRRLTKAGLSTKIIENDCHCYVICEEYLVDITATQFNRKEIFPNVVILPKENASKNFFWDELFTHCTDKDLRESQRRGWPPFQWADIVEEEKPS